MEDPLEDGELREGEEVARRTLRAIGIEVQRLNRSYQVTLGEQIGFPKTTLKIYGRRVNPNTGKHPRFTAWATIYWTDPHRVWIATTKTNCDFHSIRDGISLVKIEEPATTKKLFLHLGLTDDEAEDLLKRMEWPAA